MKYYYTNKNINKNNKKQKLKQKYKLKNITKKKDDNEVNKLYQKGGNKKEDFEVHSYKNIDYGKYKISNYINYDIDWGIMGGPPPQPDCTIL
jgi:hypothetical protein